MVSELFRKGARERPGRSVLGEIRVGAPLSHAVWAGFAVLTLLTLGTWMVFGSYSRRETAKGVLVPQEGMARVKARSAGEIVELHVREGDVIHAGQLLVEISSDLRSERAGALSESDQARISSEILDLQKEVSGVRDVAREERSSLSARISMLTSELAAANEQLDAYRADMDSQRELLGKYESILADGYVSGAQVVSQRSSVLQAKARIAQQSAQISSLMRTQSELTLQLNRQEADTRKLSNELERRHGELIRSLNESYVQERSSIVSPREGIATNIVVKNGDTVVSGGAIMTLIPINSPLLAELYVPTAGSGFISPGTRVGLRYSAFPHQKFGTHSGEVISMTKISVGSEEVKSSLGVGDEKTESSYRVLVKLNEKEILTQFGPRSLSAGMAVEGDIMLESRAIYEWVFEPVLKVARKAEGSK